MLGHLYKLSKLARGVSSPTVFFTGDVCLGLGNLKVTLSVVVTTPDGVGVEVTVLLPSILSIRSTIRWLDSSKRLNVHRIASEPVFKADTSNNSSPADVVWLALCR